MTERHYLLCNKTVGDQHTRACMTHDSLLADRTDSRAIMDTCGCPRKQCPWDISRNRRFVGHNYEYLGEDLNQGL